MVSLCARVCAVALVAAVASVTVASSAENSVASPEPTGELTLEGAINAALQRNPELAASAYELQVGEARITQAGLRPNPELAASFENFSGSGKVRGFGTAESTLSLSQVVELRDKRSRRVDVATSNRDLVDVDRQAQQLDVLAEVTRRFIAVVTAQQRLELAGSARALAQSTFDAISARVAAARSPLVERSRAHIALTRAEIEARQAQGELRAARSALAALWGGSAAEFTTARADLFSLEVLEPFETLASRMLRNPDLARFASEARLRDAEWRLAQAQARPNVAVSIGIRRLDESRDTALVAGVSMPIAVFDRNQGAIREAEVRRAQTTVQEQAAQLRIRATAFGLYQQLLIARIQTETLRNEALPQAREAVEQTRSGYERGRFSYLELATAQQELIDLQAAAIEAAAGYHATLADIERLTGEPLAVEISRREQP